MVKQQFLRYIMHKGENELVTHETKESLLTLHEQLRSILVYAVTVRKLHQACLLPELSFRYIISEADQEIDKLISEIAIAFGEVVSEEHSVHFHFWDIETECPDTETIKFVKAAYSEAVEEVDRKWKSVC
jgi:hypothetical protein